MEAISMTSTFIAGAEREVKRGQGVEELRPGFNFRSAEVGDGDPGLIRTADTQFRKLLLYPSELRGRLVVTHIALSVYRYGSAGSVTFYCPIVPK